MDRKVHAQRLRVLWKSGRDKYQSFFYELAEVQKQVGKRSLPKWCRENLGMHLHIVMAMAGMLTKADKAGVKAEFAGAIEAEKQESLDELRDTFMAGKAERDARIAPKAAKPKPTAPQTENEKALLAHIAELEAKLAAAKKAAAEALRPSKSGPKPLRDRRDYMREFMRRKRAALSSRGA
jgi:hypothetical protein